MFTELQSSSEDLVGGRNPPIFYSTTLRKTGQVQTRLLQPIVTISHAVPMSQSSILMPDLGSFGRAEALSLWNEAPLPPQRRQ